MKNLWEGDRVRLSVGEPEQLSEAFSRWGQDSEYFRSLDNDPQRLWSAKKFKEWFEQSLDRPDSEEMFFTIHTLEGDLAIGFIGLFGLGWNSGDAFVAIAIGEREYWSKGYGTDTMRVFLRFAFQELNLHRVSLFVFEYNQRAWRSYQKVGFREEGRVRKAILRDGRRWDTFIMGVLREEWEQAQP